jgi:hypothetical protein
MDEYQTGERRKYNKLGGGDRKNKVLHGSGGDGEGGGGSKINTKRGVGWRVGRRLSEREKYSMGGTGVRDMGGKA